MKDKAFIIMTLLTIKELDEIKEVKKAIEEITNFCCDYFQIKKGYRDEHGIWVENTDFTLLKIWISDKTGYEYDFNSCNYLRTLFYKAEQKFQMEKEVKL